MRCPSLERCLVGALAVLAVVASPWPLPGQEPPLVIDAADGLLIPAAVGHERVETRELVDVLRATGITTVGELSRVDPERLSERLARLDVVVVSTGAGGAPVETHTRLRQLIEGAPLRLAVFLVERARGPEPNEPVSRGTLAELFRRAPPDHPDEADRAAEPRPPDEMTEPRRTT